MTFEPPEQPPEPPVGSQPAAPSPEPYAATPPPPPPQEWAAPAQPPAQSSAFNPAEVSPYDWGILAAGFLAFIFSLFSYYTASFAGISASESAWHGFFGWFAALVALLSAGLLAVHIFAPATKLPVPGSAHRADRVRSRCALRDPGRPDRRGEPALADLQRAWCGLLPEPDRHPGRRGRLVPAATRDRRQSAVGEEGLTNVINGACPVVRLRRIAQGAASPVPDRSDTVARIVTGVPRGAPGKGVSK
jgi:hypothetical protein